MFKAVENLREQKGFTLIELLIVIAIIGILAAIAIPAFLGQREKAKIRCVEASAKGAVSEVQSILDAFVSGEAILLLADNGAEVCYESANPSPSKTCNSMYQILTPKDTYTSSELDKVVDWVMIHHNTGKNERSCYSGSEKLFEKVSPPDATTGVTSGPQFPGTVGIINSGSRSFVIKGWASSVEPTDAIFDTVVTSR